MFVEIVVDIKIEGVNQVLHTEIANPITKRRETIITTMRRLKVKRASKETGEAMEDIKKLMRTPITTSISMVLGLNLREFKSQQKLKCLQSLLKTRGKSNQIRMNLTRK